MDLLGQRASMSRLLVGALVLTASVLTRPIRMPWWRAAPGRSHDRAEMGRQVGGHQRCPRRSSRPHPPLARLIAVGLASRGDHLATVRGGAVLTLGGRNIRGMMARTAVAMVTAGALTLGGMPAQATEDEGPYVELVYEDGTVVGGDAAKALIEQQAVQATLPVAKGTEGTDSIRTRTWARTRYYFNKRETQMFASGGAVALLACRIMVHPVPVGLCTASVLAYSSVAAYAIARGGCLVAVNQHYPRAGWPSTHYGKRCY